MRRMFDQYDPDHQRFISSKFKGVLDLCDMLLGEFYGLTPEMLEYILNFEGEIRGGRKITVGQEQEFRLLMTNGTGEIKGQKRTLEIALDSLMGSIMQN